MLGYTKWDNFKNVIDKELENHVNEEEEKSKPILPISGKWLR